MDKYNVAIIGPLGTVGQRVLSILKERNFPMDNIKLLGTEANKDKEVIFKDIQLYTEVAKKGAFKGTDIVFSCVDSEVSKVLIPIAIEEGAIVIDNSNAFRMDVNTPLVIPEINPEALDSHQGLIANPNCSTIQMLVALKPIHDKYKIRRIVVSTYQAVSGTGKNAINELKNQTYDYAYDFELRNKVYPYQTLFNVIPHIDSFLDNGYTKEEMKMVNETKKILDDSIEVTATTVRIPVLYGHSESINIETETPMNIEDIANLLHEAPGITVLDDINSNLYPIPIYAENKDDVYVGRIRRDFSVPNGLNIWVVADNIRKGAALNAVQIAETLIARNLL